MRIRLAVAIAALAALGWAATERLDDPGPALFDAAVNLPSDPEKMGGFSGIEVSPDGTSFTAISDRGRILTGQLLRDGGQLTGLAANPIRPLLDPAGQPVRGKANDAEGVAILPDGTLLVSFEGDHRILIYPPGQAAMELPRPPEFARFPANGGPEALAVTPSGAILTIPEWGWTRRGDLPLLRHHAGNWSRLRGYTRNRGFLPVGADVGPDGRLYLLERHFKGLGFASRVRSFALGPRGLSDPQVILTTRQRRHGNLEGLSVWRDNTGQIRLTMIADDNFQWPLPSHIVEYAVPKTLAMQAGTD
ncbi:esterase-like activity of phytase family protein [Thalassovita sp.]|uniref:esterase-like activity of phytase family protein n=1 Tax=Thalassovita sp. TaxID=1979401 RepID=UPI0029DE71D8|nr:esterase-like activity of phytase family protein [Thalassovita sp.]